MNPVWPAKMNGGAAVAVPAVILKSWVPLNTWPVGAPPVMATANGRMSGLPFTSPIYSGLVPVPLADTQKAPPFGFNETPQALTRATS